jgi:hypothetical protein
MGLFTYHVLILVKMLSQLFHFSGVSLPHKISCQSSFTGFHKVFAPLVIQALYNTELATDLRHLTLTSYAHHHDTDLLLGRKPASGISLYFFDVGFSWLLVFFYLVIFHDKLIYFQQGNTRIAGRIIKCNNPPNQQSGKLSTFS